MHTNSHAQHAKNIDAHANGTYDETKPFVTQDDMHDTVSTWVLFAVTVVFLAVLFGGSFLQQIMRHIGKQNTATQISNINIFQGGQEKNCHKYDTLFEACVKAQQEGRGCEWYASCNACVGKDDAVETFCIDKK